MRDQTDRDLLSPRRAPGQFPASAQRIASAKVLAFTPATARVHAPLVNRAAGVVELLGNYGQVHLRDDNDQTALSATPGAGISLASAKPGAAGQPGLRREPGGGFALCYRDAAGETALGALIACIAASSPSARRPIAADPESLSVLALAQRLAASEIPVLIGGATGTGKEVLSRFIHDHSPRARQPFIAVNCAAMPEAMLDALLFGHQKGAFTGATGANAGFFRAADGGTLLLDEIAEMPLALQAKLLRALQEGEVVPIGASQPVKIDVRVIAAANRDLATEVEQGRFRADLYYRLNVFPLTLRPLQDRPDDIAPLAFAMLMRHATGPAIPWVSDAAMALLRDHHWPGNVRELENVMRRALLLAGEAPGAEITAADIQFDRPARLVSLHGNFAVPGTANDTASGIASPAQAVGSPAVLRRKLANIVQHSEAQAIVATLAGCNGSRIAAASQLGISERTLRYRLAAFRQAGIDIGTPHPLARVSALAAAGR